jgi:hypothetical protein
VAPGSDQGSGRDSGGSIHNDLVIIGPGHDGGTTETATERRNRPASRYLMPLAFGLLIGATITGIGTSPNMLISQVRARSPGSPRKACDRTNDWTLPGVAPGRPMLTLAA